jgi:hypothetical protein
MAVSKEYDSLISEFYTSNALYKVQPTLSSPVDLKTPYTLSFFTLEKLYIFTNPMEIKRFLSTHDYLIEPLFDIYIQIQRIFGVNIIRIRLEYDKDPEENFEGIFVMVETNLSPEHSLDLLEKFDEWWLEVDKRVRMATTVMVRSA